MSVIYVTYDKNLKDYLWKKYKIDNLIYGNHPKTDKPFWVYERNNELNIALKGYFEKSE